MIESFEILTGCNRSIMATRISYWLDVTGPTYNIDSACSSSNFAMTEAYKQILSGKCDAAIVASANLCLHPHTQLEFYGLGAYVLHLQYYSFILYRLFQTCVNRDSLFKTVNSHDLFNFNKYKKAEVHLLFISFYLTLYFFYFLFFVIYVFWI